MPYIPQEDRVRLEFDPRTTKGGELNYLLTRMALNGLGDSPRYEDFNRVIGALECAKMELYRRMVVPYEIQKMSQNGDVYDTRGTM